MELYDITSLSKDIGQDDLYNLFALTYQQPANIPTEDYTVTPEEEMRIDLISQNIYSSVDYADFLLDLNSIDNPLNIKSGDIIKYTSVDRIGDSRSSSAIDASTREIILNNNKSTRKDPNRKNYIDQGYSLPPNFLQNPTPPIQIVGSSLVINPL
jgi:hypothetical protein